MVRSTRKRPRALQGHDSKCQHNLPCGTFSQAFKEKLLYEQWICNLNHYVASLSVAVCWLASFIVTKFTADMMNIVGNSGTYLIYACMSFFTVGFVWFFVPETKGKTQEEMREYSTSKLGMIHNSKNQECFQTDSESSTNL